MTDKPTTILDGREPADVYTDCYSSEWYRMGRPRFRRMTRMLKKDLRHLPPQLFLDVGCGRGELVQHVQDAGHHAFGCDIVPALCERDHIDLIDTAAKLPYDDQQFDIVTCNDVLEHLRPEDTWPVCEELLRVTRRRLLIHVVWTESKWKMPDGKMIDLHTNKRDDWEIIFKSLHLWSHVEAEYVGSKMLVLDLHR